MYMQNMARALVRCGHQATVLCAAHKSQPRVLDDEGVTVLRYFEESKCYSKETVETVLSVLEKHAIDFIEGADHLGISAQLFSIKERPPIIIKVHSSNALEVLRQSQVLYTWQHMFLWLAYLRSFRQLYFEKMSYTKGDCLIAPSQAIMDALIAQGVRLPEKRGIVYNPIEPEDESHSGADQKELGSILFAGRLDIGKGIQFLPRLMRNLRGCNVKLDIAGEDGYARGVGSLRSWLEKRLGDDLDSVHFHGHVPSDRMSKLFLKAQLIIVPSRWDNFPTIVLEAMKFGVPVVASPFGGMSEMLEGTECSVLDPGSDEFGLRVQKMIASPGMLEKAGASMRKKMLLSYTPERVVEQYCSLLSANDL